MLLVIGNGFDLYCKLKSSFENYVQYRIAYDYNLQRLDDDCSEYANRTDTGRYPSQTIHSILDKCKNSDEANLWDALCVCCLKIERIKNWKGIEQLIQDTLHYVCSDQTDKFSPEIYGIRQDLLVYIVNSSRSYHSVHYKNISFYEFLSGELTKLEEALRKYIYLRLEDTPDYHRDANTLFTELLKENRKNEPIDVLSFNYSFPRLAFSHNMNNNDLTSGPINQVHGSVSNKVIVGIDIAILSDEVFKNYDSSILPFTKTYKKLKNSLKSVHMHPLSRNCSNISIFGHSLNEQDYSYFQSIFDFYDIYHSNIILIFYFYEYQSGVGVELVSNVMKLLRKYGDTFSNVNHGRNLIHKLQVESRLLILSIDGLDDLKVLAQREQSKG